MFVLCKTVCIIQSPKLIHFIDWFSFGGEGVALDMNLFKFFFFTNCLSTHWWYIAIGVEFFIRGCFLLQGKKFKVFEI
jgi:hypothetical protein